ncbi:MAG: hypothetical protein FK731_08125 [Asgard group archaeon]|nr:hypothetical protein [Asgard group archaeon]
MFIKDSQVDEEDLVLVESKDLEEKCGKCGSGLILKVYWSKKGHQQKIECTKCGMAVWKHPIKKEDW